MVAGHPPPGTAPHHPPGTQPSQGMQAKGTVLGLHTHTPAPTARGWRTPTARQVGGQSGEGQRLNSDAPHTMVQSNPPGDALPPTPQRATPARKGARCGAGAGFPRPHRPHPGHTGRGTLAARSRGRAAGGGKAPDTRRPSQQWQATPPGDGPPPPPRHAASTGHAGQGDSVGPPHPHTRAYSTWVADPNSPPSGRAVGGGTAPDLRRPSQWWKAPPPGTPFCRPHNEQRQPARAHAVGPVLGPHARTDRTRDTRVAEPWLPASEDGRPGEGQRLTPDALHNSGRPPPPGDAPPPPPRHAAPAGHAGQGDSVGPPHPHTRGHSTWVADPNSPPSGRAVGGGTAPDLRRPSHTAGRHPPPGEVLPHPPRRATPARKGARCGAGAGSPRPHRPHPAHTGRGTLAARSRGRAAGGGTAPDTRRPSQRRQASSPGDGPPPPPGHAAPAGHAGQGDSVGPPHPHNRGHSTSVADPNSPPSWRAVGGGTAPDLRRPSHNGGRRPLPGTPFRHPHSEQRRPARAHAVGPVLGPHARTDRTRDTRVTEPGPPAPEDGRPGEEQRVTPDAPHNGGRHPPRDALPPPPQRATPACKGARCGTTGAGSQRRTDRTRNTRVAIPQLRAPEDEQSGEGQRLTPDAPHNSGRPPPRGRSPRHPRGTQPPKGMQAKGAALAPHTHTPAPIARGYWTPTARPVSGQSEEGEHLTSDAPHNSGRHPPGDALPPAPRRATPASKGARCGAGVGCPLAHTDRTPGHTGRGTPANRPRGRAAGGGTASDTRRPSQRWQATRPGGGPPPPPRHAAPAGHAGRGDGAGPPLPHARAHSMWVVDPDGPPRGRATRGGTAPVTRRPSQQSQATPPETAPNHPRGARPPQGMQAEGTAPGPHTGTSAPTARGELGPDRPPRKHARRSKGPG